MLAIEAVAVVVPVVVLVALEAAVHHPLLPAAALVAAHVRLHQIAEAYPPVAPALSQHTAEAPYMPVEPGGLTSQDPV